MYRALSLVAAAFLLLLVGSMVGIFVSSPGEVVSQEAESPLTLQKDLFRAFYLSDGNTFFGQIESVNENWITLQNVYYIRENKDAIQAEDGIKIDGSEIVLVKPGRELHGPEDTMIINRAHILYIEDLTNTGPMMKAVREYEQQKTQP